MYIIKNNQFEKIIFNLNRHAKNSKHLGGQYSSTYLYKLKYKLLNHFAIPNELHEYNVDKTIVLIKSNDFKSIKRFKTKVKSIETDIISSRINDDGFEEVTYWKYFSKPHTKKYVFYNLGSKAAHVPVNSFDDILTKYPDLKIIKPKIDLNPYKITDDSELMNIDIVVRTAQKWLSNLDSYILESTLNKIVKEIKNDN